MSVCEDRVIGNTLQSDGTRIAECATTFKSSEWCESRQIYSSVHFIITTSHNQLIWVITIIEPECMFTKLNGSQFRQVYSSFSLQSIHSQTLHENNNRMPNHQTEVIANWACLFIILFSIQSLSNTAREHHSNAALPNRSDFKLGMPIHHFILWESLFNSSEAWVKL